MKKKILLTLLGLLLAGIIAHGLTPKHRRPKVKTQQVNGVAVEGCHYDLELAQWIDCDCRSTMTDCAWFWAYCNIGGCLVVDGACGSSGNLQCLGRCKDRF